MYVRWTQNVKAGDGNSTLPSYTRGWQARARLSRTNDAAIDRTLAFLPPHHSNLEKVACASSNSLKIVSLLPSDLNVIELPYSFTQCKNP